MLKMERLDRLDIKMLAIYCLQVVESAAANSSHTEQARKLKKEWALFIGQNHSALPGLDLQEDREAYAKALKQRMVSFLAGYSRSLFLAKEPGMASNSNTNCATAGRGR